MTSKIIVIFLYLTLGCSLFLNAQLNLYREEQRLLQLLENAKTASYQVRYDSIMPQFERTLNTILYYQESLTHDFKSLSRHITIRQSNDGKIKTFSWDKHTGGSYHDMTCLIQFVKKEGIGVQKLYQVGEKESTQNVIVTDIHQIKNNYLLEGWGTHGNGHHHKSITAVRLLNNELQEMPIFPDNRVTYTITAPRNKEFGLTIKSKMFSHFTYQLNEENGTYSPTGDVTILRYIKRVFTTTKR